MLFRSLPIKVVIQPKDTTLDASTMSDAYVEPGVMVNSKNYDGMTSAEFSEMMLVFCSASGTITLINVLLPTPD